MRSSTYLTLFASSVLAQESATVFNLFPFEATLTVLGTASSATTYKNSCASDKAGVTALPSDLRPTPAPTAKPRVRRQDDSTTSDADDFDFCEPYTLIQGASTYGFHMTDPSPGAWTVDVSCSWQGAFTTADLTCTATQSGYVASGTGLGFATTVFKHSEIESMGVIQTAAVARGSGSSYSQTVSASPTRSVSGTGAAVQSTGLAPVGPLPTGAMAMVGGAAGILAAALAL